MKAKMKLWLYREHPRSIKIRLNNFKDYVLEIESKFESDIDRLSKKLDDELKRKPHGPETKRYIVESYAEDFHIIDRIFLKLLRHWSF